MSRCYSIFIGCFFLWGYTHPLSKLESQAHNAYQQISKQITNNQPAIRLALAKALKAADKLPATLTAFGGTDRFFIASKEAEVADKTLVRVKAAINQDDGTLAVSFVPLAPEATGTADVLVNDEKVEKSPLYNIKVDAMTLAGSKKTPVVCNLVPEPDSSATPAFLKVYVMTKDDGTELISNAQDFENDIGFALDGQPAPQRVLFPAVAVAATGVNDGDFIITAVPEMNRYWNGKLRDDTVSDIQDGRALAAFQITRTDDEKNITPLLAVDQPGSFPVSGLVSNDLYGFPERMLSAGEDIPATGPVGFVSPVDVSEDAEIGRVFFDSAVDMWWDDYLQRMYIGLSNITRSDAQGNPSLDIAAGACSVLVARPHRYIPTPDDETETESEAEEGGESVADADRVDLSINTVLKNANALSFVSLLTPDDGSTLGDETTDAENNYAAKHIVGFYRTSLENTYDDAFFATANKVRTMHTSTGKSYLILQGGVAASEDAVTPPVSLNSQMYALPLVDNGPDDESTGFLARVDDITKPINLQPLIDQTMEAWDYSEADASQELFDMYYTDGYDVDNEVTYDLPDTEVSDITDQKSLRLYMKNALPYSSNAAQRIGGIEDPDVFNQLLSFDGSAAIKDVFVYGDTVYIAVASTRDYTHYGESGIFSSTALFKPTGEVRAWTPWKRVMGNCDAVYGMGFDENTSNFWYLTTEDGTVPDAPIPNTVYVTQWGVGDASRHGGDATTTLPGALSTIFPQEEGGVYGLFNFGPDTPGFKKRVPADLDDIENRHEQFSMMVATGLGKVALIETGSRLRNQDGIFKPTEEFKKFVYKSGEDASATIYVFSVDANFDIGLGLRGLGIISAAELSRLPLSGDFDRRGWLFVGGETGVAVLIQNYDGHGWLTPEDGGINRLLPGTNATSPGSGSDDFPGGRSWFFVQLMEKKVVDGTTTISNPFVDVRKLVSDGNKFLYVLTGSALYRVEMVADNFAVDKNNTKLEAQIPTAKIQKVASITESKVTDVTTLGKKNDQFFDCMLVKRDTQIGSESSVLLVGTSNGLFISDEIADMVPDLTAISWTEVVTEDNNRLGPAFRMKFSSTERGVDFATIQNEDESISLVADGNLMVSALGAFKNKYAHYRFDVQDGAITPFNEPYPTDYFYQVGSVNTIYSNQLPSKSAFYIRSTSLPVSAKSSMSGLAVFPKQDSFLKKEDEETLPEINLNTSIKLPLRATLIERDDASGMLCFAGDFGVRVNE